MPARGSQAHADPGLTAAAQLFKVLGSEPRLWLLRLIGENRRTVSELALLTEMSQPLVSQHLRTLRQADLVVAIRSGKEVAYTISDAHVTHVIDDAIEHSLEDGAAGTA